MRKQKIKYVIAGNGFTSKEKIIAHIREYIYTKYQNNQDLSQEHLEFMIDVLKYHQNANKKIGCGVKRMFLKQNDFYPNSCFWLERVDGTFDKFSYSKCFNHNTPLQDFKTACRRAIAGIASHEKIKFFKTNPQGTPCPVLGIPMTFENTHVDHAPPNTFAVIFKDYLESKHFDGNYPIATDSNDIEGCMFSDKILEREWIDFHNTKCDLRVISSKANLMKGAYESESEPRSQQSRV